MSNTEQNSENIHVADQVYFLYDPQPVRLLDVIYVGPVMIYGGIKGKFHPFVKWSLIGVGICTILYNGANFFINEKKAYERRKQQEQERLRALEDEKKKRDEELSQVLSEASIEEEQEEELFIEAEQTENEGIKEMKLPKEVMELLNEPYEAKGKKPIVKPRATKSVTNGKKTDIKVIENGKSN